MLDSFGREVSSLRISVTQKCNLSCFFCHREGEGSISNEPMSRNEILKLVELGKKLGIERVKITGGEPLLRSDIVELIGDISGFVDEVSLVTNGTLLSPIAMKLKDAGLGRVNISLHSLIRNNYCRITGVDRLEEVKRGIDAALDSDLRPVKLNAVVLRGINDGEIENLIDFASEKGAILQLIELQKTGDEDEDWFQRHYLDLSSIEAMLSKEAKKVLERDFQRRRRYFLFRRGREVEVEVVRPTHNSVFCMNCTRLRVTSDGRLKPCLMRRDNLVEFVSLMRGGADEEKLIDAFKDAIRRREPFWKA
ncbi:MAG: GTP 3',8-cyclase MoaA [Thermoproteota archaeon]